MLHMSSLDPQTCACSAGDSGQTGANFPEAQELQNRPERRAECWRMRAIPRGARLPDHRRRCHSLDEARIDVDVRAVGGIELKEFHEDRAARLRTRCMARGWRIADVAARRIVAALVLKDSI